MSRWLLVEADDDLLKHRITERAQEICIEQVPGVLDIGEGCCEHDLLDTLWELGERWGAGQRRLEHLRAVPWASA